MLGLASSQLMGCHGVLQSGGNVVGGWKSGDMREAKSCMPNPKSKP